MNCDGSYFGRATTTVAVALLLGLFSGCVALQQPPLQQTAAAGQIMVRTELFFGLSRPNGADVTDTEFAKFLTDEVTPRFPSGYSVIRVQGHWREQTGRDREEPSRVLILLHPRSAEDEAKIELIRSIYKTRFAQEAVLRTDEWEKVSF
jgi:hypothetical protein